jgi:hypothetical protein
MKSTYILSEVYSNISLVMESSKHNPYFHYAKPQGSTKHIALMEFVPEYVLLQIEIHISM